ncbi:MAG TPA: helix-turn-helix domain-containing protein [Solirubrobacterales bacterium]
MSEFDRLAAALEADLDPLVTSILERLHTSVPTWMVETFFEWEEISRFTRASVRTQLSGFRRGVLPEHCPEVDAAGVQTAAKVGDLKVLLNGYRVCQMSLWERWLDLVEASANETQERQELLKRGSEYFFRYAGLLSDYVADIYQRELEQAVRNGEQRRLHAIRDLFEGDPQAASQLDLDLEQHHLGLLAWGPGGDTAARDLATRLARPLLLVAPLERTWWGWISGRQPFEPGELRAIETFEPAAGAGLAVGLQEFGARGFRATHRQAQRARMFAPSGTSTLTRYADVAVEAIASENEEEARRFVERELGAIGDDSATSLRIRETIAAYFAAGHNAASAAATLGVHEQTVANRLRTAEERLGHPIGARRVELELALRLRASLRPDE